MSAHQRHVAACPSGVRAHQLTLLMSDKEMQAVAEIQRREGVPRSVAIRQAIAFYRFARDPAVAAALRAAEDRV